LFILHQVWYQSLAIVFYQQLPDPNASHKQNHGLFSHNALSACHANNQSSSLSPKSVASTTTPQSTTHNNLLTLRYHATTTTTQTPKPTTVPQPTTHNVG
jgi:hypothetical protein